MPILLKLLQKTEEEVAFPNSFCEATITLIWKTKTTKKEVALDVKNLLASSGDVRYMCSILGQKDPLEESMEATPVFLPGESRKPRSLVGYSP